MKKKLIITLFGSTGDLVAKKILPTIAELLEKKLIEPDLAIMAVGRKNFDAKQYLDYIKTINKDLNVELLKNYVAYVEMDILSLHDYFLLKNILKDLSDSSTKFVHYFALAPSLVLDVSKNLKESNITANKLFHNIVFEKPFGEDFKSARRTKKELWKYFDESQIYRIDHYLGKDIVKKIYDARFNFEQVLELEKNEALTKITILASEKEGILNRGKYYDKAGATKDMLQSHIMQILALTTMQKPACYACDDLLNSKVKAVKKLKPDFKSVVFGQYSSYVKEKDISKKTQTETLVFAHFVSSLVRGVDIFVLTGKKMDEKKNSIVLEYSGGSKLVFEIEKGVIKLVKNKKSKALYKTENDITSYGNLILELILSDKRNFVRYDEIESSWKLVDKILKRKKALFVYENNQDIVKALEEKYKGDLNEIL